MLKCYLLVLYSLLIIQCRNLKCELNKGIVRLKPSLNFKTNINFNLSFILESLTCTPETPIVIFIQSSGNSKCPIDLKEAKSKITILTNQQYSVGEGKLTVNSHKLNFKGFMRIGTQASNPVDIKAEIIGNPLETASQCFHDGLANFRVAVTRADF